jgi:hypothetical protein
MPMGPPPHEPPATKSGRADCVSYRRPRPGQRLDQPVGEASNESIKEGGEGQLEAGSRSAPGAAGPGSGGAASQMERPAGEGGRSKGQNRRDHRGDWGAASSLYPGQAARGANSDRAGLDPKGQRTGNQTSARRLFTRNPSESTPQKIFVYSSLLV